MTKYEVQQIIKEREDESSSGCFLGIVFLIALAFILVNMFSEKREDVTVKVIDRQMSAGETIPGDWLLITEYNNRPRGISVSREKWMNTKVGDSINCQRRSALLFPTMFGGVK